MRTLPLEDNSGKVAGEAEWGFKKLHDRRF